MLTPPPPPPPPAAGGRDNGWPWNFRGYNKIPGTIIAVSLENFAVNNDMRVGGGRGGGEGASERGVPPG